MYQDVKNLYGCAMSQRLPVDYFDWVENTSQFNEDFAKHHNEDSDTRYFLDVGVQYPIK